jgi:diguanylate cyclase (GGDEF)-like protein
VRGGGTPARDLRSGDIVARLGGDEFVILLEDVSSPAAVAEITERVVESFARPIVVGTDEAQIGTSVGVAIASSARITPRALLRQAEIAMYRADQIEQTVGSLRAAESNENGAEASEAGPARG